MPRSRTRGPRSTTVKVEFKWILTLKSGQYSAVSGRFYETHNIEWVIKIMEIIALSCERSSFFWAKLTQVTWFGRKEDLTIWWQVWTHEWPSETCGLFVKFYEVWHMHIDEREHHSKLALRQGKWNKSITTTDLWYATKLSTACRVSTTKAHRTPSMFSVLWTATNCF